MSSQSCLLLEMNVISCSPQPSEDGASHNGGMEMSFDNEIDSGIWDMMLGREGQMSVHELSTTLPDLPNGHPKSLASIFPSNDNDENEQEEKAYIPDTEPVMSYKVPQTCSHSSLHNTFSMRLNCILLNKLCS